MRQQWTVTVEESGQKLIAFLKSKLGSHPSRQIKKGIESNGCTINGRTERFASTVVGSGDKVTFFLPTDAEAGHLLFEDDHFFIYNKPSGVSSENFHKSLAKIASPLFLLHRLDKETSGLLMFGKSAEIREAMIHLFRQRKIEKSYFAIVDGIPKQKSGVIDNYLNKRHVYQGQSLWGKVEEPSQGLHAITEWELIQKGKEAALLLCKPRTGRTHQLRVHCSEMSHPILGDYQYGRKFRCSFKPLRCLLHAWEISFTHPVTDRLVKVQAPMPKDMEIALQEIGAR